MVIYLVLSLTSGKLVHYENNSYARHWYDIINTPNSISIQQSTQQWFTHKLIKLYQI